MDYSLSDSDLMKALGGKTKIIPYNELKNYSSIDQVVAPYNNAIILYLSDGPNSGHWTCLIKHPDRIEFFCSYGDIVDSQFRYIDKKIKLKYNFRGQPYLSKLLRDCGQKVEYNHINLQKDGQGIATCGRWVILRILLNDVTLEKFGAIMTQFSNPDDIAVKLTNKLIK
jgi:hypothetical protein